MIKRTISIYSIIILVVAILHAIFSYALNRDTITIGKNICSILTKQQSVSTQSIYEKKCLKDVYTRIKRHEQLTNIFGAVYIGLLFMLTWTIVMVHRIDRSREISRLLRMKMDMGKFDFVNDMRKRVWDQKRSDKSSFDDLYPEKHHNL